MTDHERGAYAPPTDPPLSFNPRQPVRRARAVPVILIISVLVLAGLVAAVFVFYRAGVRQAGQPPQTVGEPIEAIRAPAPAEAQPQDPAAGLEIYRGGEGGSAAPATPKFTPPPEQPQARSAPPVVVAPPPRVSPPPAPRPAPPSVPTSTASGGPVVQVGAVSSSALADQTWNEAVAVAPGLAVGKGKSVQEIEVNGSVLYRSAVTGFANRVEATAFCDRLKAAGKSCFVR